MYSVLSVKELNRLREKIRVAGIHSRPTEPIDPAPLMKHISVSAQKLEYPILGYTMRWRSYPRAKLHTAVGYDVALNELSESTRKRHVLAHEFGHVFHQHDGNVYYLYRDGYTFKTWGLEENVMDFQDRQCEWVAAFVLIPLEALLLYRGKVRISEVMDVPPHLVELRWQIWNRFGR